MKTGLRMLLVVVFSLFLVSGTAFAVIIDFSYDGPPAGEIETNGTFGTGEEIPITAANVINNPYGFNGPANVNLLLDFAFTATENFIRVYELGGPDYLNGSFSSFVVLSTTGAISIFGTGPDAKAEWLLRSLGIPLNTNFAFFGFTIATSAVDSDSPGYFEGGAYSVDIANTSVPEPTTMLLLGFGLIGLAGVRRLRK